MALDRQLLGTIKTLHTIAGSSAALLANRMDLRAISPDISDTLVDLFKGDLSSYERKADEELSWCEEKHVTIRTIESEDYPSRLRNCFDAPLVLFTRGKADLNARHIIAIVGTRKCTPYGQDAISVIVRDLSVMCPDIVIVSGLAYGIDIASHRAALSHHLSTVGVVAHGQGMLYPITHRKEANTMCLGSPLSNSGQGDPTNYVYGGVVTEYFHDFRPFAQSFLQRNRLIAGMSDATIVVESASHGGGLVTARIAQDYGREVMSVPGPINSDYSVGTNNLIRDNKASLITSASDILSILGWHDSSSESKIRSVGIERQLFPDLTPDEQRIVEVLKHGDQQSNALTLATGISIGPLTSSLFNLEMKGVVKPMSGNTYHLIS